VVTNRVADVIAPQTINLPSKWSMLVKGFAPNWDSTQTLQNYLVFEIVKDTNNRFEFYKSTTNRKWIFRKTVDTVGTSASADFLTDYNKYQIQNMLAVQSDSNIIIYILLNNGTVIKASTPQATAITGQSTLYFIGINGGTLPQANALAESFHFLPD
jgi:hypothetical protein